MTGAAPGSWPRAQLAAVGRAYRGARGRGANELVGVEAAEVAFLAAGGDALAARATVLAMVAYLAREHIDWLLGPAQAWLERNQPQVPETMEIFDPPQAVPWSARRGTR